LPHSLPFLTHYDIIIEQEFNVQITRSRDFLPFRCVAIRIDR
jgi:hypothetical protein